MYFSIDSKSALQRHLLNLIVESHLVTRVSAEFFVHFDKYFDYLIGYLSNTDASAASGLLRHTKQTFVAKLARSGRELDFFARLSASQQLRLLDCCFDMLSSSSSSSTASSSSVRECLLAFRLDAAHFVHLLAEKARVNKRKEDASEATTTKQMKKQMKSAESGVDVLVDWKCLRLVLELMQASLAKSEQSLDMEVDEREEQVIKSALFFK